MKLSDIQARLEDISIEVEALADLSGDEPTQEQQDNFVALNTEAKELETKLDEAKAFEAAKAEVVARRASMQEPQASVQPSVNTEPSKEETTKMTTPAKAKYNSSKVFASSEDAFLAGQFLAATAGNKNSQEFMAAQTEGTDSEGGYTVPAPLAAELINLTETYGVARNACRRVVMGAPTWSVPNVAGHSTIYYPAEAASITESAMSFGQVTLNAKKMAGLVKISSELSEDSLISIADTVIQDLAWGFAKEEDTNLFLGKASALYTDGIKGDSAVVSADVASVAALTLADLTAATISAGQDLGLSPQWYMNSTLFNGPIRDLLNAAGGNQISDLVNGVKPTLFGYPVNFVTAMTGASASTSGDMLVAFGDLSVSHYFGDRRNLSFRVLNELFAQNDQVGIICTQRVDIASVNAEVLSRIVLA